MNIGNRTSVKSGDIRHIEHRTAIWHRYRFGSRRHLAARCVNYACWLTHGSAIVQPWHTSCMRGVRLISVRDIQRYLRSRHQRASDDGVSEEGYVRGMRADNAVKLGCDSASLSTPASHRPSLANHTHAAVHG